MIQHSLGNTANTRQVRGSGSSGKVALVPLCGLVACVFVVGCSAYILFKLARRRVPVLQRCHVGACGRRVSAFHRYALVVAGVGRPSVVLCLVVCVCICRCVPFLRRLCCLAGRAGVVGVCVCRPKFSPDGSARVAGFLALCGSLSITITITITNTSNKPVRTRERGRA